MNSKTGIEVHACKSYGPVNARTIGNTTANHPHTVRVLLPIFTPTIKIGSFTPEIPPPHNSTAPNLHPHNNTTANHPHTVRVLLPIFVPTIKIGSFTPEISPHNSTAPNLYPHNNSTPSFTPTISLST